ncbi:MAG: hypothetical protein WEC81_00135 [Patescibacteria group bacterium]
MTITVRSEEKSHTVELIATTVGKLLGHPATCEELESVPGMLAFDIAPRPGDVRMTPTPQMDDAPEVVKATFGFIFPPKGFFKEWVICRPEPHHMTGDLWGEDQELVMFRLSA